MMKLLRWLFTKPVSAEPMVTCPCCQLEYIPSPSQYGTQGYVHDLQKLCWGCLTHLAEGRRPEEVHPR